MKSLELEMRIAYHVRNAEKLSHLNLVSRNICEVIEVTYHSYANIARNLSETSVFSKYICLYTQVNVHLYVNIAINLSQKTIL